MLRKEPTLAINSSGSCDREQAVSNDMEVAVIRLEGEEVWEGASLDEVLLLLLELTSASCTPGMISTLVELVGVGARGEEVWEGASLDEVLFRLFTLAPIECMVWRMYTLGTV